MRDIYGTDRHKVLEVLKLGPRQSPVSFFDPDFEEHPNLQYIDADYYLELKEGDCVFVPAFYFIQYKGLPNVSPSLENQWPTAIAITLKYKSNSAMLGAFFEAVEDRIVT